MAMSLAYSQWGGGGYVTSSNELYLPSLRLHVEGGSDPPLVCAQSLFMSNAIVQLLRKALILAMKKIHVLAAF